MFRPARWRPDDSLVKIAAAVCALIAAVAAAAAPAFAISRGAAGFTVAVTQRAAAGVSITAGERETVASGVLSAGSGRTSIVAAYAADAHGSLGVDARAAVSSERDARGAVTVTVRLPAGDSGVLIVASAT